MDTTTTTASSATAAAATAIATAGSSPISSQDNETECRLLGSFAILVQLALGGLALMSLVYKRWRERPQRPVKIWFFDASKQVFGSVLVHAANVFMSLLTSGRFSIRVSPETVAAAAGRAMIRSLANGGGLIDGRVTARDNDGPYVPNPCSFYLLNLAIDTTLGIPILIVIVRVTTKLVTYTPLGRPAESVQSGHYGNPPNAWWWLKQSIIYFCGLMGMKLCVLVIFMVFPWISRVGDWALGWTEGNERLQIVFVMMLFPLIMNAMQYYIIDSYIKEKTTGGSVGGDSDYEEEGRGASTHTPTGAPPVGGHPAVSYEVISASDDDDESGSDDSDHVDRRKVDYEEERFKKGGAERVRMVTSRRDASKDREYDPTIDGDTVVGSTSSRVSTQKGVNKELIPPS
ncbi:vacuolar membrane protein-domain-containing protein [Apodospora peruviana]|uniref:Vacuolar membrane protein-domain-containing protein n=1 Tax=Apodospora peruviana TaxID=516989 RepID=A0AAE0MEA0_9PEZI|nr:vacuolar membrane protein-domain-containing protein [Apodospora peruviana]